jgi:hypothetical protein
MDGVLARNLLSMGQFAAAFPGSPIAKQPVSQRTRLAGPSARGARRPHRGAGWTRRNWQILGSERGGEVACRLYLRILSYNKAGVDPQAYNEGVLARLSTTKAVDIA